MIKNCQKTESKHICLNEAYSMQTLANKTFEMRMQCVQTICFTQIHLLLHFALSKTNTTYKIGCKHTKKNVEKDMLLPENIS